MIDRKRSAVDWIDLVWLLFIAGLAFLPPINEVHKQLILVAFALLQFLEGKLIARLPHEGPTIAVGLKILLGTLLLDHTGDVGINSEYYPIYFLPVVTAAIYYGPIGTLLWSALASLAYCSFLIPALELYEINPEAEGLLALRILFFFLVGILVNRFVVENRKQVVRYQALSETLEETNRQLRRAEADARRSERLAALGQMSAGLAHEIRNPLGVIKGSAEMLVQKLKDAEPLASELAGYIFSEVNRLNALVARFLDFARPSNLELRPVQIAVVLDRALESVQAPMPNAKVRVERQYASVPDIQVDEQLCERVFVNLIQNAYQAMESGDGTAESVLSLRIAREPAGVQVTVEDTGPGVPPELREQVFNPFYTSKKNGVGLGLAIVAKFVDAHRGRITLEPNSPRGARFRILLPSSPV
jgi:two-component system, NtrC family, sensor histidine kinase HydH